MNQKIVGTVLILAGIILSIFVFVAKEREDKYIADFITQAGTCYLSDGTCLHEDRDYSLYIVGWVMSASLLILGVYILAFDHASRTILKKQEQITEELKEVKKKDEFKAFLTGFSEDEQIVLKAIREQDGIKQSTLRYKTDLSKTALSLILKDFEEREIITRKVAGKTNEIYLRKKF